MYLYFIMRKMAHSLMFNIIKIQRKLFIHFFLLFFSHTSEHAGSLFPEFPVVHYFKRFFQKYFLSTKMFL